MIVNVLVDVASAQGEFPTACNVIITLPAALSAALALYLAPDKEVGLLIVPGLPLEVQSMLAELSEVAPVVKSTSIALEQNGAIAVPALALGAATTVITASADCEGHGPLLTVQRIV